jgi:hypothetical protein
MKDVILHFVPEHQVAGAYVEQRNTVVATQVAELLGAAVRKLEDSSDDRYFVPSTVLAKGEATELGIANENDLLGSAVEHPLHSQKTILHPLPRNSLAPHPQHSRQFTKKVTEDEAVLPGFSAFSFDDAKQAARSLNAEGHVIRIKNPAQNDGKGQRVISDPGHLEETLMETFSATLGDVRETGVVLEADLQNTSEICIGQICLGGAYYSYYGNEITIKQGSEEVYGGTDIFMMRGGLEQLATVNYAGHLGLATRQALAVYDAYSVYEPVSSRINLDVLQGYDKRGIFYSGVVDQSLRVAGSTPAELLAIKALQDHPDADMAQTRTQVFFNPAEHQPYPGDIRYDYDGRCEVASLLSVR